MDPTPLLKCVSPQKTSIIFWKSHIFQKNLNKITKKFTILVKLTARFIFDLGLLRAALERSKVLWQPVSYAYAYCYLTTSFMFPIPINSNIDIAIA